MSKPKHKLSIEIENLTESQVIAINDFLATWQILGGWGSSRWTAFYADGDGDFRPQITINGEKPKFTDLIDRKQFWEGDQIVAGSFTRDGDAYRIDFDWIGWKLQEKKDGSGQQKTQ